MLDRKSGGTPPEGISPLNGPTNYSLRPASALRHDAIVGYKFGRGGVARRDARRGDGLGLLDPGGDLAVQFQKLGQQVLLGRKAVGVQHGRIQGGVRGRERIFAGQFQRAIQRPQASLDVGQRLGPDAANLPPGRLSYSSAGNLL